MSLSTPLWSLCVSVPVCVSGLLRPLSPFSVCLFVPLCLRLCFFAFLYVALFVRKCVSLTTGPKSKHPGPRSLHADADMGVEGS